MKSKHDWNTCEFPGCGRDSRRRSSSLCDGHHQQVRRGAELTPLRPKRKQGASLERDDEGRKECRSCYEWKPESEFGYDENSKSSDRMTSHCRLCIQVRARARRHGLRPGQVAQMMEEQGGVCALCGSPGEVNGSRNPLSIDHDHDCCPSGTSCGECVRALLCYQCNHGIGQLKDDPELLRKAAAYVEDFRSHRLGTFGTVTASPKTDPR